MAKESSAESVNIGPGSLLYQTIGDRRINFTGLGTGITLLMHPAIGAGVAEHSDVFEDVWGRTSRSLPLILGSIYADEPVATARQIIKLHIDKGIKGTDHHGQHYNALHPETWWWAHATFHTMVEDALDHYYDKPLHYADREKLYAETTTWYQRYGLTMRPVPLDYQSFVEKRDHIYEDVLQMTPAAEHAVNLALTKKLQRPPEVSQQTWRRYKSVIREIIRLTAIGEIPPQFRERLDIPWSQKTDEPKLQAFAWMIKKGWPKLSTKSRYYGIARYAHGRDDQQLV